MPDIIIRKNNIRLADYDYQRDIKNRLLMAEFTLFDVEVLRQILEESLTLSISELANHLQVTKKDLQPVLKKLSLSALFRLTPDTLYVDKEMRKYYESQLLKFDEHFEPDLQFLRGLLNKVPIHVLPNWYSLPASSHHIFQSIVENYLLTPKMYQQYLCGLKFDSPVMHAIVKDLLAAPDFIICAHEVMQKYQLSRESFEEYMLLLEFNFVCCLGYRQGKEEWHEVVTPFHEWHTYLRFQRDTLPQPMKRAVNKKQGPSQVEAEAMRLYDQALQEVLAMDTGYRERDVREIERSLRRFLDHGWLSFEDFIRSATFPLGDRGGVFLVSQGKRWEYHIPTYQEGQQLFIKRVIFEAMGKVGFVVTHKDHLTWLFCVTPLGKRFLEA
jgi:hypothetical protein